MTNPIEALIAEKGVLRPPYALSLRDACRASAVS